jgi:hypothetical protein
LVAVFLSCKCNEDKKVIQKNIREIPAKKTETLLKKTIRDLKIKTHYNNAKPVHWIHQESSKCWDVSVKNIR